MRAITLALAAVGLSLAAPALAGPPPPYARQTLANGLEVIVVERHATPLMTVEITVHNGAMAEPLEYSGLSHLYEHMFFKGNKGVPDQLAYSTRLRELGMLWNGTTDDERVNYFFTTTSDHFAGAMTFMKDAITSPLFDAKELERERVVVTGEMDRDESDPNFLLWRAIERKVFWQNPTRHDALGDRKTVLTATPEKMRTIQGRYYVPNNALLVITGDVKADEVFKSAEVLYRDWKRAPDPFVKFPVPKDPPIKRAEVVLVKQPMQTFVSTIEWQGPASIGPTGDDSYAADLLGTLVAEPASKFQKNLVDSGACVRASFTWTTRRHGGPITVDFEASEANVDTCVKAVFAEVAKLASPDYFNQEELANAAKRIDIAMAKDREGTESYAHALTWMWTAASLDYYATYSDHVHAVTRPAIAKLVGTYLLGKPFVFGAVESPALAKTIDEKHLEGLAGLAKGGAK